MAGTSNSTTEYLHEILTVKDIDELDSIKQSSVLAAIWRRTPLPKFQTWIDSLPGNQLPTVRVVLSVETIIKALNEVMEICGTPACVQRKLLVEDIAALASIFASINQTQFIRLRLEKITKNQCNNFHIDPITMRLVCTYRGPDTRYCFFTDGKKSSKIFDIPTGSPIVMRCRHMPMRGKSTLLHRSPPIIGSSKTRLLLALDPVDDPENDIDRTYSSLH